MQVDALERSFDKVLYKSADSVLGRPDTVAGAVGQTALYALPVVGSAMSIADGVNDMWHGRWRSGIGNLALGVGSGVLDFFSLGGGGTALRTAMAAGRGAKGALGVARAAKAGANAARTARLAASAGKVSGFTRAMSGLSAAKGYVRGAAVPIAGKGLNMAQRGARTVLGARGYNGLVNAGRAVTQSSRDFKAFMNGWKSWRPVQAARSAVGGSKTLSSAYRTGSDVVRGAKDLYRAVPASAKGAASLGFNGAMLSGLVPYSDLYFAARPGASVSQRMLNRSIMGEGSMNLTNDYINRDNPYYQEGKRQAEEMYSGKWLDAPGNASQNSASPYERYYRNVYGE